MMEKLNEIDNGNPFKVPDNYFEEVKRKIILSASETSVVVKKPHVHSKMKPWFRIAASVAILCALGFTGLLYFSQNGRTDRLSGFSAEEFPYMLLEEIDITTLEENFYPEGGTAMGYQMEANDIIDYLLTDNFDITEIEEHF